MPQEAIEILKSINQNLEDIKNKENLPKLLYAKDIADNYRNSKKYYKQKEWKFLRRYLNK